MMRSVFPLFVIAVFFTACSIEENTTFKLDFSGKTITRVDMSAMIGFIGGMDSTGSGKAKFYTQIQKGMDSVKNSKNNDMNLEMGFDTLTNMLSVSFSFKNLDDANRISTKLREKNQTPGSPSTETPSLYRWQKKDKVLVMPGLEDLSKLTGGGGNSNPMMNGITYTVIRTFPKKIVKVSDSRVAISNGGKTMTFKATAEQLSQTPLKEITITFK